MPLTSRRPEVWSLDSVVQQHVDELTSLYQVRRWQALAPHVRLFELERLDARLAAHIDGLRVAGPVGRAFCTGEAGRAPGVVFAMTVIAIEGANGTALDELLSAAGGTPTLRHAVADACAWVRPELMGFVAAHVETSRQAHHVEIGLLSAGLGGCSHAERFLDALAHEEESVRSCAVRTAGEFGRTECFAQIAKAYSGDRVDDVSTALALVLLGDRGSALSVLARSGVPISVAPLNPMVLAFQAMELEAVRTMLGRLHGVDAEPGQDVVLGSGISGDPRYVPWLIRQLGNRHLARLAAEAISLISGLDIRREAGEAPPDDADVPSDADSKRSNTEIRLDEGLPWPDHQKVEQWWVANGSRFQPGQRYFLGEQVTWEHCVEVLKSGYQRQRILAAQHLCLLGPGTPLFNTSAPAWRQQRLLAQMT